MVDMMRPRLMHEDEGLRHKNFFMGMSMKECVVSI